MKVLLAVCFVAIVLGSLFHFVRSRVVPTHHVRSTRGLVASARFSGRRVLSLIVILLAAGLSTFAAVRYWKTRPMPFDRSVWKAEAEGIDDFRRHRMADWLVKQRRLVGMSRVEIIAMLGEPTKTSHFREYDLVYVLGNERGWMSIDSEWLLMRLDGSDRVSMAEIARD